LALLLFFAVVPLLLSIVISHAFFYRAGMHLSAETERELSDQAHAALQKLVDGFQQLMERDRRAMETALNLQAGHGFMTTADPSKQDLSPPLAYAALQSYRPGTVSRQISIFETGRSFCYPTAGRCLDTGDPRQTSWYRSTRELQTQTRTLGFDPASAEPAVIVAKPLRDESGRFVGVTALARPVETMLADLRLSENWFGAARTMLVTAVPGGEAGAGDLRILASRAIGDSPGFWRNLQPQSSLQPDTPAETRLLLQRIADGQGGSLELGFQGVKTHWIFSAASSGEPFALILLPHSQVIARAVAARAHVVDKTLKGLGISGALLVCAVAAVFFTAILASKKVTRPLSKLATTAGRLAGGDYRSRVEIDTSDELGELGQVFNQLGPALAERERMASSLALAGDIQRHLLPQEQPQVKGFEIFGGALSCDETGGDYFDFIPLKEDQLALVVGDVSGHGIGAALLMAGARGVLRSHAPRRDFNLSLLLATLNKHLCRDTADEQFMTMFYGVLSNRDRRLRWCSAGHGPFFLYRCHEQNISELGSTGLPLGIIDDAAWEEGAPIDFAAGDILLVGTDGIWEARNPRGEVLGTERLKAQLRSQASNTAAQIHASIIELVSDFRDDSQQEDDITLSVIKAI
jgi:sigma-B regulation protein RsbU (phosphoserine phosphatase)